MRSHRIGRLIGLAVLTSSSWLLGQQAPEPVQQPANSGSVSSSANGVIVPRLIRFSGAVKNAQGQPRSGVVGITFSLYKDQEGGAALWLETQNVTLDAQGRYTVLLGSVTNEGIPMDAFASAEARWLGVQSEGQAEQRVLLVSVPYALKAADADTLGGRPASSFVLAAPVATGGSGSSGSGSGSGTAGASSTSGVSPAATCSAPPCPVLTSGGTANFVLKFTDPTTADNSSIAETPCPGTASPCVGIGTTNPTRTLDVNGEIRVAGGNIFMQRNLTDLAGRRNWAWGTETFNVGDVSLFVSNGPTTFPSIPVFTALSNGFMGIGLATPKAQLEVAGSVLVDSPGVLTGNGSGLTNLNGSNLAAGTVAASRLPADVAYTDAANSFTVNQTINGNLTLTGTVTGVGAAFSGASGGVVGQDPVNDGANRVGVQGMAASSGGAGVVGTASSTSGQAAGVRGFASSTGGAGVFGQAQATSGTTAGVRGLASSTAGFGVSGDLISITANTAIAGGSGVAGTYGFNQDRSVNPNATAGFGVLGRNPASAGTPQGVRGEATATTGFTIGVAGVSTSTGGIGTDGFASATTGANIGTRGTSASDSGIGVDAEASNTTGNTVGVRGFVFSLNGIPGLFDIVNAGAPTSTTSYLLVAQANGINRFRVRADGTVTATGFFVGGGADFAEAVEVAGNRTAYEPGDLLVIDPTSNRRFALATVPYSTLAAGVYSTKPGLLGTEHPVDDPRFASDVPLAVMGIVPCKVSAENGAIQPGDLLVSSSMPGHAMKGTNRRRMLGAVVGKALQPLSQGTGVIQVLVTLQ